MKRLFQLTALLLVAVWLPCTAHCRLETLGIFPQDDCCSQPVPETESHSDCPTDHGPGSPECADCNTCQSLESGGYALQKNPVPVLAAQFVVVPFLDLPETAPVLNLPATLPVFAISPPDLPRSWQFLSRASLPVRAPSLAS